MKCPRCESYQIDKICDSPVGGAWEVYFCEECHYSWRSTETPNIIDKFRLNKEEIKNMVDNPPIATK